MHVKLMLLFAGTVKILRSFGAPGLFIITFMDATFLPLPHELVFLPLSLANPERVFFYAFVGFTSSTLAGIFSYVIGNQFGHHILEKHLSPERLQKVTTFLEQKGIYPTLIASFAVPFKVFTIVSGALQVPKKTFLLAVLVSRATWFFTEAAILFRAGRIHFHLLARYRLLSFVLIFIVISIIYYIRKIRKLPQQI